MEGLMKKVGIGIVGCGNFSGAYLTAIPAHVPTHVAGTMHFASGALVQVSMSYDVPGHKHQPIELYGTDGAILAPRSEPL